MGPWRQRLGMWTRVRGCWGTPGVGGARRILPRASETPWRWTSILWDENCEKTHFYCFEALTLWGFVKAVLRKHTWGSQLLHSVFSGEAESPCSGRSCTWMFKVALLKVIITVRNLGGRVTGMLIILMVMMNSQCLLMSKFRELSSLPHVKISK